MKRCKHLNAEVVEDFIVVSIHEIRNGYSVGHYNDTDGEYSGRFSIKCYDCNRNFSYASYKAAPAWARHRWDVATTQREAA